MKTLFWIATSVALVFLGYRYLVPKAFVSIGKGSVSEKTLLVQSLGSDSIAFSDTGESVEADEGSKFVRFSLDFAGPPSELDVWDFQLVRSRSEKLGEEQNIGDNFSAKYYFWTYLNALGVPIEEPDETQDRTRLQVAFHIDEAEFEGFLFYWGEYFGPYQFGDGR
ncbi:MAG: hypothetical protein AAFR75_05730 [Pseudomonadota bacterium]